MANPTDRQIEQLEALVEELKNALFEDLDILDAQQSSKLIVMLQAKVNKLNPLDYIKEPG